MQDVFAQIWDVPRRDALLTSMDALILWRKQTQGVSLHRDRPESTLKSAGRSIRLVQSLCVLTDSTAETGGFICCPGENFDSRDLPWKRVYAQRGDLICWDAGCRHGSKPPPPVATPLVTDTDRASRRLPVGRPGGKIWASGECFIAQHYSDSLCTSWTGRAGACRRANLHGPKDLCEAGRASETAPAL